MKKKTKIIYFIILSLVMFYCVVYGIISFVVYNKSSALIGIVVCVIALILDLISLFTTIKSNYYMLEENDN